MQSSDKATRLTLGLTNSKKIKDKTIGFLSILMVIFLDHLESTEKNKNNDANITIGINIAL